MKKLIMVLSATALLTIAGNAFAASHDGGGGPKAVGDGHCNYTQENMFAGPFKVCQMPTDAGYCAEIGDTDDNADAVQADGACGNEAAVGYCDIEGGVKLYYYEGDPGGLEIGCGFMNGEWVNAE
jgi:hypothetical protein